MRSPPRFGDAGFAGIARRPKRCRTSHGRFSRRPLRRPSASQVRLRGHVSTPPGSHSPTPLATGCGTGWGWMPLPFTTKGGSPSFPWGFAIRVRMPTEAIFHRVRNAPRRGGRDCLQHFPASISCWPSARMPRLGTSAVMAAQRWARPLRTGGKSCPRRPARRSCRYPTLRGETTHGSSATRGLRMSCCRASAARSRSA